MFSDMLFSSVLSVKKVHTLYSIPGQGSQNGDDTQEALEWHTGSWLYQLFPGRKARDGNGVGGKLFTKSPFVLFQFWILLMFYLYKNVKSK